MGLGDAIKRGLDTLTGKNVEATAEQLAEVHGEILLGMDARLDALERKVGEAADLTPLRRRMDDIEARIEQEASRARRITLIVGVAVATSVIAVIVSVVAWILRS